MRSAVDLMKAKDLPDPDLRQARGLIDRQVTLMARLLDDLLDVGRIARDRLELRRERVDLRAVIHGALELNATLIQTFAHQVHLDLPRGRSSSTGMRMRLGQVFGNLVNNACRYSETGGHVSVTARLDGPTVEVTVTRQRHRHPERSALEHLRHLLAGRSFARAIARRARHRTPPGQAPGAAARRHHRRATARGRGAAVRSSVRLPAEV